MNAKKILQTLEIAEAEIKYLNAKLHIAECNALKDIIEAQEQLKRGTT